MESTWPRSPVQDWELLVSSVAYGGCALISPKQGLHRHTGYPFCTSEWHSCWPFGQLVLKDETVCMQLKRQLGQWTGDKHGLD